VDSAVRHDLVEALATLRWANEAAPQEAAEALPLLRATLEVSVLSAALMFGCSWLFV
jgi:hypothetical protein